MQVNIQYSTSLKRWSSSLITILLNPPFDHFFFSDNPEETLPPRGKVPQNKIPTALPLTKTGKTFTHHLSDN